MIAFQAASAAVSAASASSATITWPGSPSGQMLLAVFGFENVSSSATPQISSTVQSGWSRSLYQPPSATGCALEVWNTQGWSSGPTTTFNFTGALAFVAQGSVYTGQFTGAGNVIRASVSQAWTGNNPAAPTIYAFVNELLIVCASDLLNTPGYGNPTPAGFSAARYDSARGGSFGNVEITCADKLVTAEGNSGAIPWAATATSGTTKGSTATLAVRAAANPPTATSPAVAIQFPVA